MFKLKSKVRRNPRIWKNDKTVFTIVKIEDGQYFCQRAGKTRNFFTGEMEAHKPMPYLTNELIAA